MKAIISCPICHSGKIQILEHRYKVDGYLENECLCRKCGQQFTLPQRGRKVEE